jgi:hypothetical protein
MSTISVPPSRVAGRTRRTTRYAARRAIVITLAASYVVLVLTAYQGWPLWGIAAATVAMWVPIFTLDVSWTYRTYGSLASLYVVTVLQTGHCGEHVVQMVQIHLLGLSGDQAHGIVGVLDNEWVHFVWNNAIALGVFALLARFRHNPWLWVTAAACTWHSAEHMAIMYAYLAAGVRGAPGLLGQGGVIGGGLPINVTDLHFFYNVVETVPLIVAFLWQCRKAYEERDQSIKASAGMARRALQRLERVTATRW